MLKLALPKARELGMERLLVTAKDDNMPSRAIIQACGGQLEAIIYGPVLGYRIARYFIHLSEESL